MESSGRPLLLQPYIYAPALGYLRRSAILVGRPAAVQPCAKRPRQHPVCDRPFCFMSEVDGGLEDNAPALNMTHHRISTQSISYQLEIMS